jgi:PAS domain S-box-containing protein
LLLQKHIKGSGGMETRLLDKEVNISLFELEAAVNACEEGIYICNPDLRCLWINKAYERITGTHSNEMIGRTSHELVHEGIISSSVGEQVLTEGKTVSLIQIFRGFKKVLVTGTPVFNMQNELKCIVITARDLTELNKLEKKLKAAEERSERYLRELEKYKKRTNQKGMVCSSKKMQEVLHVIDKISAVDSPVLLLGESGTGKEVIAKHIHETSKGVVAPFIKVNCGAIPSELLESELFGYESGAFTGALQKGKKGLLEAAHNGTLFLDEIGELPLSLQVKFLRVLQDFEVTRLGSTRSKKVNFRLLCATNRPLTEMVKKGEFRQDLFYRIHVIPITLPPLRERKEEITEFVQIAFENLSKKIGTKKNISSRAMKILENYSWPGNVRELNNLLERIYVMNYEESIIDIDHLPSHIVEMEKTNQWKNEHHSLKESLEEFEKYLIEEALNKSKSLRYAAKKLKVDPSTLSRKCEKYEISYKKYLNYLDN